MSYRLENDSSPEFSTYLELYQWLGMNPVPNHWTIALYELWEDTILTQEQFYSFDFENKYTDTILEIINLKAYIDRMDRCHI